MPDTVFHVVDEVKEHEQVQVWTAEGYISDGSGDGPETSEEEQPDNSDEEFPLRDRADLAGRIRECFKDQHIRQVPHVMAFTQQFLDGDGGLQESDFADTGGPLPDRLQRLIQHPWFKQFAKEHRQAGKTAPSTASSSSSPLKPVSGVLAYDAMQVMQLHQYNQAEETLEKNVGRLQEVAKEAIANMIQYCKREVNEVPIIASIQGHVEEVNGQLAGMQHDINVVDDMNDQRHTQTMAIATHILEKQRAQDRRLAALERKVKALPKKKASPKKNAIKKVMKAMKAKPMKAMKKHSHV